MLFVIQIQGARVKRQALIAALNVMLFPHCLTLKSPITTLYVITVVIIVTIPIRTMNVMSVGLGGTQNTRLGKAIVKFTAMNHFSQLQSGAKEFVRKATQKRVRMFPGSKDSSTPHAETPPGRPRGRTPS